MAIKHKAYLSVLIVAVIFTASILIIMESRQALADTLTIDCEGLASSPTPVNEADLAGDDVTFFDNDGDGYCVLDEPLNANSVIIDSGAVLIHPAEDTDGINITTTGDLTIEQGGIINVDRKGCPNSSGPDNSNICAVDANGAGHDGNPGAGAGHGSVGGDNGPSYGQSYDDEMNPALFGAGGGDDTGASAKNGGKGGGFVVLNVGGTFTHNGTISAAGGDGQTNSTTQAAGGGAGGSIYIKANSITGTYGTFSAVGGAGGNGSSADGGGGAGGRIYIEGADKSSLSLDTLTAADVVAGGDGPDGANEGGNGSYLFAMQEVLGWGFTGGSSGSAFTPGLFSFNCENLTPGTCIYDHNIKLLKGEIKNNYGYYIHGWAWIPWIDPATGTTATMGWIQFSNDVKDYLNTDETLPTDIVTFINNDSDGLNPITYNPDTGDLAGWARIRSLGSYGWSTQSANDWGWLALHGTVEDGSDTSYGVTLFRDYYTDQKTEGYEYDNYAKLKYYAWSPNGSDSYGTELDGTGLGFAQFDLSTDAAQAWFQALYGDIYSKGGINAPASPDADDVNATYLILTDGDITGGFKTDCTDDYCLITDENIDFPADEDSTNIYRSDALGRLDVNSLINNADVEITSTSGCADEFLTTNFLQGKVYYYNGDLKICNEISINDTSGDYSNCTDNICLGNGTIIINGDLTVNEDIVYSESTIGMLPNLASAAWIIKGNLTINPSVKYLSGVFIVLGDGTDGSGAVYTGEGNYNLIVKGLMMAHSFYLERDRIGEATDKEPSEQFIYDGRALANVPPGLEDFLSLIPELSIDTPQ